MKFVVVTGVSGAGKTQVLRCLEDMGFFCMDNLPPMLLTKFVELCAQTKDDVQQVAVVVDIRGAEFFDTLGDTLEILRANVESMEILYLDADDAVLIQRYKESRRTHPLNQEGTLEEAIHKERQMLSILRERADYILDTTTLRTSQLKEVLYKIFQGDTRQGMAVQVVSFGFKRGLPLDADLVFDVRFLPNPYYIEKLRNLNGTSKEVQDYVFSFPEAAEFMVHLKKLLTFLIPFYIKEGKTRLVMGIGCTGGKHRSVAIASRLADALKQSGYHTNLLHRDMQKESNREIYQGE